VVALTRLPAVLLPGQQFNNFVAEAVDTIVAFAAGGQPASVVNPGVLAQANMRWKPPPKAAKL
jgi:hypothetical protein